MRYPTKPPSDRTLGCFVHGVAHLIKEQGYTEGLATATRLLAHLATVANQIDDIPPQSRDPIHLFPDDDLSITGTPARDGHDHADQ